MLGLIVLASPVFRSLLKPKLILGVPYEMGLGILLGSLYAVMIVGVWVIPAILIGVLALRMTIAMDPFALKLYKRYAREGDIYQPCLTPYPRLGGRTGATGERKSC